ncbi:hypothetical protein NDU88_002550 [Pleurodeles waltl]|uniref:Uncharacterized protein n=1 Tax=Pleurodeles waltl TaxID=8319 RepID=A0AAV7LFW4_PLEWA|nr:hypothetical protein NDU88_002550 [Pleurodeles waltl]
MEQYTTLAPGSQRQTRMGGPGWVPEAPAPVEEPSRAELLAAIQGSCVVLEEKLEAVAGEVNLLWKDLWGAARTSGVDDTDWRKRGESRNQISARGASGADGSVEIQQDGTMAVVVTEMTDESTEPSDVRMESVSVDS